MPHDEPAVHVAHDVVNKPIYVVTTVFNPVRFHVRWKWYQYFAAYMLASGGPQKRVKLITVEVAYGNRDFVLDGIAPDGDGHKHVKLRTNTELWIKENCTRIGMQYLPPAEEAPYVAWIDADVTFARQGANWVHETLHQLQHYDVVQMFSDAVDLGPLYIPVAYHKSFMWCYHHMNAAGGLPKGFHDAGNGYYPGGGGKPGHDKKPGQPNMWHPGFAWAAKRSALDGVGGLIDFAILGAGDNHMARGLIGKIEDSIHPKIHPRYRERLLEWQRRADGDEGRPGAINRRVGYVSGLLTHYWHGRKVQRGYWQRWNILTEQQYNPDTDIQFDTQGLLQLVPAHDERTRILRDRLMRYFRSRNEDSIDLEGVGQDEWRL